MKASVRHIRISPKKANLVATMLGGMTTTKALDILSVMDKRAADIIYKLLASAVANAENNEGKKKENLVISRIWVTKGRTLRRGVPASRGRVAPIKKRSSHIFLELAEVAAPASKKAAKKSSSEKGEATDS